MLLKAVLSLFIKCCSLYYARRTPVKLKDIESIILKHSSNFMIEEGKKLYKEDVVGKIKGKNIEDIYHIYGEIKENQDTTIVTHIKINKIKEELEGVKCTCNNFKVVSKGKSNFICEHIIATMYKFLYLKGVRQSEFSKPQAKTLEKRSSTALERIKRKIENRNVYYESGYGIGREIFRISQDKLKDYLIKINAKRIKFTYDTLEIIAPVLNKDLPLSFTLKMRDNKIVLTTHKKLPKFLDNKGEVALFNNELYITNKKQMELYLPLYKKFKLQGAILYSKNIDNYNKLLNLLSRISKEIHIREELREFVNGNSKPKLYLSKKNNDIYCKAYVNYGDSHINILEKESGRYGHFRDESREAILSMKLERYGFIKDEGKFKFLGSDEDLFSILKDTSSGIYEIGEVAFNEEFKNIKIYDSSYLNIKFYKEDNNFIVSCFGSCSEESTLQDIYESYKLGRKFYKDKENNFIDLKAPGIKEFFYMIEALDIDLCKKEEYICENKLFCFKELYEKNNFNFMKDNESLRELQSIFSKIQNINESTPKNFKGELRAYQLKGLNWLKSIGTLGMGGILADDMGLGKTIQCIAFILSEKHKKSLIVCPTSLIYNWRAEFKSFAPSIRVGILHGDKKKRIETIKNIENYDVVLTTYGTLKSDIELYNALNFDYLIIDEAQNIKNSKAMISKTVKEIEAKVKLALTGTPIENNLLELWSIFDFVMPGYLGSEKKFQEKFLFSGEEGVERLRILIRPFILRRSKEMVLKELPDKIERKHFVEMEIKQNRLYNSLVKRVTEELDKNNKIEVFSYLTKLRQICLEPSLVVPSYNEESCKITYTMELLKKNKKENKKTILFSQFTSVLDKLENHLNHEDIKFLRIDGSTKSKDRLEIANKFNNEENIKVILISLKAGGTGLNLTSAKVVVHFDPWWNPAVEDQATDRAHRIGQKNIVEVVKLITRNTIEEKIVLMQENKKQLIDSIITGELHSSSYINKLCKEDIIELFSGS